MVMIVIMLMMMLSMMMMMMMMMPMIQLLTMISRLLADGACFWLLPHQWWCRGFQTNNFRVWIPLWVMMLMMTLMSHTAPELDESTFNLLSNESRQMTILSGFNLELMRTAVEKLRTCVSWSPHLLLQQTQKQNEVQHPLSRFGTSTLLFFSQAAECMSGFLWRWWCWRCALAMTLWVWWWWGWWCW